MPEVAEAIRRGGGPPALPWAPEGRPEFNRSVFLNLLARQRIQYRPGLLDGFLAKTGLDLSKPRH
jgi:hypothetical protein